jgi:choloylglycine hydrolase
MKKIACLFALLLLVSSAFACTDFAIKAKDGTVVNGRTMEFPVDLKSKIVIIPQKTLFTTEVSSGMPGISWETTYGFVGINEFGYQNCFVEGFNEKGLSLGGLMFTGAQYQTPVPGRSLPLDGVSAWLLGSFGTVDEVKAALPTVTICASNIKKLQGMGLHLAVHDAGGKNLVVEFINGEVHVYDNPIGVLTNRPDFPWQMNNLRNYVNLKALDVDSRMLNGVTIEATGVGSGMRGLPGDWTPPSRFVRVAYCLDAALKPKNSAEAVNLAEHLLNMIDIPKGTIKEPTKFPLVYLYGYAQWVVIKDLTNKVLHYRTYDNTAWKSVNLMKYKLTPGSPIKTIPLD